MPAYKKDNSDNLRKDDDSFLSEGKQPHENRPFTIEDKILVILKISDSFTQNELRILSAYRASKRDVEETLSQHNIGKTKLYALLKRVGNIFNSETAN